MVYHIEAGGLWEEEISQGVSIGQRPIELSPVEQFLLGQIIDLKEEVNELKTKS
jgi:hypothetical protein